MTDVQQPPAESPSSDPPDRRRPTLRTVGRVTVVVLAVAALVATGLWIYANARLNRVELPSLDGAPSPAEPDEGAAAAAAPSEDASPLPEILNVLVVGLDTREGLSDEDLQALGTEQIDGGTTTDTIILVQVSPTRDKAALLSFPRDLKVTPQGLEAMKINGVHEQGGPDLLIRTIESYTGIDIDHYVEINLNGFIELTDAIGGVEICLDEPKVDPYAGVNLPAGCQTLDGRQASGFVRSRHDADQFGPADDFGRIARQQEFIRRAMGKMTSVGTLVNPLKVKRLIDVVAANVTTDQELGTGDMFRLANALKGLGQEDVELRTVPGYWEPEVNFVLPYPERAEALFQSFRTGEALPDVGRDYPGAPPSAPPGGVTATVLNAAGAPGLAADVAERLRGEGVEVSGVGDADRTGLDATVVRHGPGAEAAAQTVAALLGDAQIEAGDDLGEGEVVVLAGQDQVPQ